MGFTVAVYGARGSIPACGENMLDVGGNTSCVLVTINDRVLIFDAGSGIVGLGRDLLKRDKPITADLFLSHAHYDHLIGLPFFGPLTKPETNLTIWTALPDAPADTENVIEAFLRPPFFPVTISEFAAKSHCRTLGVPETLDLGDGVVVRNCRVNHPGGAYGFRVEYGGRAFCYVSDFEHDGGPMDATLASFLSGADLAFMDSTYTPENYDDNRGFGHASWLASGEICETAKVRRWRLFHHFHLSSDKVLGEIEVAARSRFPNAALAREGDVYDLVGAA
ncbi:MAG: MBL fold metallo-hydrolase [Pseudomonadota bacterium]